MLVSYLTLPYLNLPSGEDVLPPCAEASDEPFYAHPRINHKVTNPKCSIHLGTQQ